MEPIAGSALPSAAAISKELASNARSTERICTSKALCARLSVSVWCGVDGDGLGTKELFELRRPLRDEMSRAMNQGRVARYLALLGASQETSGPEFSELDRVLRNESNRCARFAEAHAIGQKSATHTICSRFAVRALCLLSHHPVQRTQLFGSERMVLKEPRLWRIWFHTAAENTE